MVLMVYNQENHVTSYDNYHWEGYWKKALVVPLKMNDEKTEFYIPMMTDTKPTILTHRVSVFLSVIRGRLRSASRSGRSYICLCFMFNLYYWFQIGLIY